MKNIKEMKWKKIGVISIIALALLILCSTIASATTQVIQFDNVTISADTECIIDGSQAVEDTDGSDGRVLYLYGAWKLKQPDGTVIQEQPPQQIPVGYYAAETTFIAEELGTYTLDTAIFYAEQEYIELQGGIYSWELTGSGACTTTPHSTDIEVVLPPQNMDSILYIIDYLYDAWMQS